MTIPATASQIVYSGDGSSDEFVIPFIFDTVADLKVILTDADGDPAEITTGFSVTGGSGATGTLIMDTPPAADETLTILDDPELTQTADYTPNDGFPADAHEAALDRTVRQVKRLHQRVDRSIRVRDGDSSDGSELLLPLQATRAGLFLAFDVNGNPTSSSGTGGGDTALRTDLANGAAGPGADLVAIRRTDIEIANAVVPADYTARPGLIERYGTNSTPGTTDMTNALNSAATVSAAGGGDVVVTSASRVMGNVTIPAGATLKFEQGGSLTVDAGFTLTINGKLSAGRTQVFSGDGTVVYGDYLACREAIAFPEWFGAVHANGAGSTDDTSAIQKTINMVAPAYGAVSLSTGYYRVTSTLTLVNRVHIYGPNWIESVIVWAPSANDDSVFEDPVSSTDSCEFDHFAILATGAATGKRGFTISGGASDYKWHHMSFTGLNDWCVSMDSAQRNSFKECRFGNTHNATNDGTAILTSTYANRLSITENNRFFNNDRDITINGSGSSISIRENAFESTGALASVFSRSIAMDNVAGFEIDLNYIEGVRTSTTTAAIQLTDCVGGSVDKNLMNGNDGATTYTDVFVEFIGNSRGCHANNNKFADLGITSGRAQFIVAGSFVIEAHGNHYEDAAVQLTTYQDVVARLGSPANIDLDLPRTFTYDPGNLADGAGETSGAQTMTGATFGDTIEVAAPYDLQGVLATAYVSASNTIRVRLQNETGGAIDLASGTWRAFRRAGNL